MVDQGQIPVERYMDSDRAAVSGLEACLHISRMADSSRSEDRIVDTCPAAVNFHLLEFGHFNHRF